MCSQLAQIVGPQSARQRYAIQWRIASVPVVAHCCVLAGLFLKRTSYPNIYPTNRYTFSRKKFDYNSKYINTHKLFSVFQMLAAYLAFCGIAIHNAQIFDAYSKEYDRNKVGLTSHHSSYTMTKSENGQNNYHNHTKRGATRKRHRTLTITRHEEDN